MAAKLLSLYLLAVAGLQVIQAAPLILDQRSPDNSNGISQELSSLFNTKGAGVAVTRAEPSILDQRSVALIVDPVGRAPQGQSPHDVRQSTGTFGQAGHGSQSPQNSGSLEKSGAAGTIGQSSQDAEQGGKKKSKAVL